MIWPYYYWAGWAAVDAAAAATTVDGHRFFLARKLASSPIRIRSNVIIIAAVLAVYWVSL